MSGKDIQITRRSVGGNKTLLWALGGVVVLLVIVLVYLLSSTTLFVGEPTSDLERDRQLLLEGLKSNPDDPAVLITLAEVEFDLGKTGDSFEHGSKAAKLAPQDAPIQRRYAQLLIQDERYDEAMEILETLVLNAEDTGEIDVETQFLLGQIAREQGDTDLALKYLSVAVAGSPVAADIRLVYAGVLEEAGKDADAILQYQAVLKFIPDSAEAIAGLKRLGIEAEETSTTMPGGIPAPETTP